MKLFGGIVHYRKCFLSILLLVVSTLLALSASADTRPVRGFSWGGYVYGDLTVGQGVIESLYTVQGAGPNCVYVPGVGLAPQWSNTCGFRWVGGWHPCCYYINGSAVTYERNYEVYDHNNYVITSASVSYGISNYCIYPTNITGPVFSEPQYLSDGTLIQTAYCSNPVPGLGPSEQPEPKNCPTGNPVFPSNGEKQAWEIDFQGTGSNTLSFTRKYRSTRKGWAHNYEYYGVDFGNQGQLSSGIVNQFPGFWVTPPSNFLGYGVIWLPWIGDTTYKSGNQYGLIRQNGQMTVFGTIDTPLVSPMNVNDRLTKLTDSGGAVTGFSVYNAEDDSTEVYSRSGLLQSSTSRSGIVKTMTYSSADKLIRVTDSFGHQLNFTYDTNGNLSTVVDSNGEIYTYGYNEASVGANAGGNLLTSVTYPGGKKKIYWYNEPDKTSGANLPGVLTGITDENGVRYASYSYDATGRAISEEHAGGVAKYSFDYSVASQATFTDPIGSSRTERYIQPNNTWVLAGRDQPAGSGCAPSTRSLTYDTHGNVATRTEFDGSVTSYSYDLSRNLETQRIEGYGSPQAATYTTTWHSSFRLPIAIGQPLKRTTFNYDANGNLLSKMEQATTDPNGSQGLSSTLTGSARTWTYTYNSFGQVLTAVGPRTDVLDKTTYTYDAVGNLSSTTSPTGLQTQYTQYDASGRLLQSVDPKGVVTDISYTPRGWVSSVVVTPPGGSARTTTYSYDFTGQLTGVSNPDGTSLAYAYDPAHRLTGITDTRGNSVVYTLDNAGNRTAEQIKDPSGTLQRSISRSFDALNRVQQITGAVN